MKRQGTNYEEFFVALDKAITEDRNVKFLAAESPKIPQPLRWMIDPMNPIRVLIRDRKDFELALLANNEYRKFKRIKKQHGKVVVQ